MYVKSTGLSLTYKAAFAVLCLYGLYLHTGLADGALRPVVFAYYTILSNIACLLYALVWIVLAVRHLAGRGIHPDDTALARLRCGVVMLIAVTFLVYNFMLLPLEPRPWRLDNVIVHYIVPLMMIFDWLIFGEKGKPGRFDPLIWLAGPGAYFVFILIRAQTGQPFPGGRNYPYPFIDIDALGPGNAVFNIAFLLVFFLLLGYIIYFADKTFAWLGNIRRQRRRGKRP